MPLKVFTRRNFAVDFLPAKSILYGNNKIVAFEAPFGGLGATYDVYLRVIEKLVGDFLLVIIELFFARCFCFVTIHAFDRQTDGRTDRQTSTAIPCVYASHSRTVKMLGMENARNGRSAV